MHGLSNIIYRCVDIEMDYHFYAVFLRFERVLKGHIISSWWSVIRIVQISNPTTEPGIVPQTGIPVIVGMFGILYRESDSKATTVTKMAPSRHPIPVTFDNRVLMALHPLLDPTMGRMNARRLTIYVYIDIFYIGVPWG